MTTDVIPSEISAHFKNAQFPVRVDGSPGKEKNFFPGKKSRNVGFGIFLFPHCPPLPCAKADPLFKKSGVFCKVDSSLLLEIIYPYKETALLKKQGILLGEKLYLLGNY